jgi:hypothetical protein
MTTPTRQMLAAVESRITSEARYSIKDDHMAAVSCRIGDVGKSGGCRRPAFAPLHLYGLRTPSAPKGRAYIGVG